MVYTVSNGSQIFLLPKPGVSVVISLTISESTYK